MSLHSCSIACSMAFLAARRSPFLLDAKLHLKNWGHPGDADFIRALKHDRVHTWLHLLISVSFCSSRLSSPRQRNHCYYRPNCGEPRGLGCTGALGALQELAAHDCCGSLENHFHYATCEWLFYLPVFVWMARRVSCKSEALPCVTNVTP